MYKIREVAFLNKLISEEIKYNGKRFKIVQRKYVREDGLEYLRDSVEPGDATVILPINENNEVIFIKQFRETINKVALELPAGMIDECEKPEDAARRELKEETGIDAKNIEFLTSFYPSCGYTKEKLYVYVARDFEYGDQQFDETEEILSVEKIKLDDCIKMVLKNKLEHASVNIAIMNYYIKYCIGGTNE
jgi:ADP-ribose pyrophosphatase